MSDNNKKIKSAVVDEQVGDDTSPVEVDAITLLEQQVADNLHGWQKALADYQNLQKSSEHKLAHLNDYLTSALVLELLPIFDNYRLAVTHIPAEQQSSAWAVGLEHILKMWEQFLSDHQVTKIVTEQVSFDPRYHEAIDKVHDQNLPDQQIVKELSAGYILKDALIRPAQVVVNNLE